MQKNPADWLNRTHKVFPVWISISLWNLQGTRLKRDPVHNICPFPSECRARESLGSFLALNCPADWQVCLINCLSHLGEGASEPGTDQILNFSKGRKIYFLILYLGVSFKGKNPLGINSFSGDTWLGEQWNSNPVKSALLGPVSRILASLWWRNPQIE